VETTKLEYENAHSMCMTLNGAKCGQLHEVEQVVRYIHAQKTEWNAKFE